MNDFLKKKSLKIFPKQKHSNIKSLGIFNYFPAKLEDTMQDKLKITSVYELKKLKEK